MNVGVKIESELRVAELVADNQKKLGLEFARTPGGEGRSIRETELQRPGLALAGFLDHFHEHRIQVFGNTEIAYLRKLDAPGRKRILETLFSLDIPCVIVTNGNAVPAGMLKCARPRGIEVLRSPLTTTAVVGSLREYLGDRLSARTLIHGTLVDVYGIGTLITGRSGIGKSEVALDLVARGHRLIADDVITVRRKAEGLLVGKGNEALGYHMEIRGVGIVDVQSIYGIRAVRKQKRIEVQVELVDWDSAQSYERTGLEEMNVTILNETLPLIRLPIYPGKNISMIVEVIAMNQLLKFFGHHAAREFDAHLRQHIRAKHRAESEAFDDDVE